MRVAAKLRALRTACSSAHFSRRARVSLEARSRPGARSCVFVGMIATKVKGTTKPMSTAPTTHRVPPPRSQAAPRKADSQWPRRLASPWLARSSEPRRLRQVSCRTPFEQDARPDSRRSPRRQIARNSTWLEIHKHGACNDPYCWGLTNQANRRRADCAQTPPARRPIEREVRRPRHFPDHRTSPRRQSHW